MPKRWKKTQRNPSPRNNILSLFAHLHRALHSMGRSRNLALVLAIGCGLSAVAIYIVLSKSNTPLSTDSRSIIALMLVNLVLLLSLVGIIIKRVVKMVVERRQGSVGSRLQTRIVVMFSLIAIIPSVVMAAFSVVFMNYGIQTWFDTRVSTAIEKSVAVADAYLEEHKKIIRADILGTAADLNREAYRIRRNPQQFDAILSLLAGVRKLPEAIVFQDRNDNRRTILARTRYSLALEFTLEELDNKILSSAQRGDLVTVTNEADDRVIALIKLENYLDTYLLVGRFVDNTIMEYLAITKGAAGEYQKLKGDISSIQITFFLYFILVSLLVLLVVTWYGLTFAVKIVRPVAALVQATEKVKRGDWSVRVTEGPENDEVATLGRAFNRMLEQLEMQKQELISAQRRAAWSDVARRIAHEIKNPLTPIQLAAERLRRKYKEEVTDMENFTRYTDTIIRHVGDIGRMVDEFASFGRMPAPVFAKADIVELVRNAIFSRQCSDESIKYLYEAPSHPLWLWCDKQQMEQVFLNLFKNAEEAFVESAEKTKKTKEQKIKVTVEVRENTCYIQITDNAGGFPENLLEHLTEPYVTTKAKGTGLGLAIVKKIVGDHGATIHFYNGKNGACVDISLPLYDETKG